MSIWLSRFDLSFISALLSKTFVVLLVSLFGWQLGKLVIDHLNQPSQLSLPTLSSAASPTRDQTSQSIASNSPSHLLGRQASIQSTSKSTTTEPVTVSKLNLKVLGILALSDKRGVAIIKSGSRTSLVATGEKIQNGVTLEAVYPDYVVINHRGVSEKLVMNTENSLFKSTEPSKASSGLGYEVELARLSKEIRRSPMKITQYVRFQLINTGGQVSAIKVWPKADVALFNALGFQAGDLLKKVNGHSISAMMKTPALWQKLLNEKTFQMEVERLGSIESFVVSLD